MVVDAAQALVVLVVRDPGRQHFLVECWIEKPLPVRRLRRAVANVVPSVHSAVTALTENSAGYPVTVVVCPLAPPGDPVESAWRLFPQVAPDHAALPVYHAAGSGSSGCESPVAALAVEDSAPPNTAAGKLATAPARERKHGSTGPIRDAAAPNRFLNDRPSVAAHPYANRGNTRAGYGSSEPGRARRRAVLLVAPRIPKARCTRNWRTSYLPGKSSTCRRKRRSLNRVAARNRPDNRESGQVAGKPED